jgi:hypothetical protein
MQAPRDEQRAVDFVDMRQPAKVEMRHTTSVARPPRSSQRKGRLPIGLQVANLPHIAQKKFQSQRQPATDSQRYLLPTASPLTPISRRQ